MRFYALVIAGLVFITALAAGTPLYAQDTKGAPPDEVSALPDKYIVEMEGFFTYCKGDGYLSNNFDCRCLSVEYIDQRTEKGAAATSSEIIKAMKKEQCRHHSDDSALAPGTAPEEDYSDIPDNYIIEANNFYNHCNATYELSMNYECECMATKFLDLRIKNGPDMPPDEILMYLSTECPNTAGAAAHIYDQCLTQGPLLPLNMTVEDFCKCTANTFAKIYKNAHISAGSQQYTSLRSSAMLMCTELPGGLKFPNLAERPK